MAKSKKKSSKHRVSVHKSGKVYKVAARSPYKGKVQNPSKRKKSVKRGFFRSNPGPAKGIFTADKILSVLSVIAGGLATVLLLPKVAALAPTSWLETAKKWQGAAAVAGGLVGSHYIQHPKAKLALLGVAGIGGVDLAVKTLGSQMGVTGVSLLAGDLDEHLLHGMPEVGGVEVGGVEVGGYLDNSMRELGQGMDFSMAGLDYTEF